MRQATAIVPTPVSTVAEADLRAALAERLGDSKYGVWFGEGTSLGVEGDAIRVAVPNGFFREWIASHYAANLIEAAESLAGRPLRLDFRIDAGDVQAEPTALAGPIGPAHRLTRPLAEVPAPTLAFPSAVPSTPRPAAPDREIAPVRPRRRLEDFIVGPGSRLAQAAALEMARGVGSGFNPLVIHGGIGLGKSHLLEGIAAGLRASRPGLNVVQVTAEAFTNGFLDAMRAGSLASFRSRYRNAGALIVDDVHFLAAKRATQDEFQHTFDALVSAGAPVVLSTDVHPRIVPRLTDELATRFLGGMVVKLEAPDPATRREIPQGQGQRPRRRVARDRGRLCRRAPARQRSRAGRRAQLSDRSCPPRR